MSFRRLFPMRPIIGMVHLPPLPAAPNNTLSMQLAQAGLDACVVENVGDAIKKPVLIGNGITLSNAKEFYSKSDGILLGEPDFKVGGVWGGPSDEKAYAKAVRSCRS